MADVRWNAALGLAQRKDAAARPVVAEMLDRQRLAAVPELTPDQAEDAVLQAVAAAAALQDPPSDPRWSACGPRIPACACARRRAWRSKPDEV